MHVQGSSSCPNRSELVQQGAKEPAVTDCMYLFGRVLIAMSKEQGQKG